MMTDEAGVGEAGLNGSLTLASQDKLKGFI